MSLFSIGLLTKRSETMVFEVGRGPGAQKRSVLGVHKYLSIEPTYPPSLKELRKGGSEHRRRACTKRTAQATGSPHLKSFKEWVYKKYVSGWFGKTSVAFIEGKIKAYKQRLLRFFGFCFVPLLIFLWVTENGVATSPFTAVKPPQVAHNIARPKDNPPIQGVSPASLLSYPALAPYSKGEPGPRQPFGSELPFKGLPSPSASSLGNSSQAPFAIPYQQRSFGPSNPVLSFPSLPPKALPTQKVPDNGPGNGPREVNMLSPMDDLLLKLKPTFEQMRKDDSPSTSFLNEFYDKEKKKEIEQTKQSVLTNAPEENKEKKEEDPALVAQPIVTQLLLKNEEKQVKDNIPSHQKNAEQEARSAGAEPYWAYRSSRAPDRRTRNLSGSGDRPLSQPSESKPWEGDAEHKSGAYVNAHEHSSTESTHPKTDYDERGKRANLSSAPSSLGQESYPSSAKSFHTSHIVKDNTAHESDASSEVPHGKWRTASTNLRAVSEEWAKRAPQKEKKEELVQDDAKDHVKERSYPYPHRELNTAHESDASSEVPHGKWRTASTNLRAVSEEWAKRAPQKEKKEELVQDDAKDHVKERSYPYPHRELNNPTIPIRRRHDAEFFSAQPVMNPMFINDRSARRKNFIPISFRRHGGHEYGPHKGAHHFWKNARHRPFYHDASPMQPFGEGNGAAEDYPPSLEELREGDTERRRRAVLSVPLKPSTGSTHRQSFNDGEYTENDKDERSEESNENDENEENDEDEAQLDASSPLGGGLFTMECKKDRIILKPFGFSQTHSSFLDEEFLFLQVFKGCLQKLKTFADVTKQDVLDKMVKKDLELLKALHATPYIALRMQSSDYHGFYQELNGLLTESINSLTSVYNYVEGSKKVDINFSFKALFKVFYDLKESYIKILLDNQRAQLDLSGPLAPASSEKEKKMPQDP